MPTLIDTIVCETIRQEANNKISLLGIFGDDILVPQVPTQLPSLAILQKWKATPDEIARGSIRAQVEIRIPGANAITLPEQSIAIRGVGKSQVNLLLNVQGFPVPAEGDISVVTSFDGKPVSTYQFPVRVPSPEERQKLGLLGFSPIAS